MMREALAGGDDPEVVLSHYVAEMGRSGVRGGAPPHRPAAGVRSALLVLGYALAVAWCAPTGTQASAQYSYSSYRSTMGRYFGGSMMGGGSYGWMMSPAGYRWMTGVVAGSGAQPPGKRYAPARRLAAAPISAPSGSAA